MTQSAPAAGAAGQRAWTDNAVLLWGARKSGSTLLMNLLDGGEELLVYPNEIKLKVLWQREWADAEHRAVDYLLNTPDPLKPGGVPGGGFTLAGARCARVRDGKRLADVPVELNGVRAGGLDAEELREVLDPVAYLRGIVAGEAPDSMRELLGRDMESLAAALVRRPARLRMWGMKEVGGNPGRVVRYFHELFPAGKVIVLTRDPYYVVRSIIRDRRRRGVRLGAAGIVRQVVDTMRQHTGAAELLARGDAYVLPYEDLVGGDLPAVMRGICDFLGLEFSDVFTRPTTFGRPVVVRTSSQATRTVFNPQEEHWSKGLTASDRALIRTTVAAWSTAQRAAGRPVMPYAELRAKAQQGLLARAGRG